MYRKIIETDHPLYEEAVRGIPAFTGMTHLHYNVIT